jgi:hypothetical protein
MRFLVVWLFLTVWPGGQTPARIEIGPRCDCSVTERESARRAGFNAVFTSVAPGIVRVDIKTPPTHGARQARLALWKAFAGGARRIALDAAGKLTPDLLAVGETAGVITKNEALFAPLAARPRDNAARVDPAADIVSHILESPDAIVIIAVNEGARTTRVKLTFPSDIPEAIWQNMEAGNAVNFVMGPDGPFYEHTFSPHDALVLAIRKRLR